MPLPDQIQTAVVTGAASGFGAVVSRALHKAGFRVILSDIDEAAANPLAEELDLASETAVTAELDITKPEDFKRVLDKTVARWGSVEVLVNNAAVTQAAPVMEISPEDFNTVLTANAGGTFAGCQIFGRHFAERGYGRIINMGSLAGQNGGTATGAHYAASKGAIGTLTKIFARELAPRGVTVNTIAPGPMDTPMVHALIPEEKMPGLLSNIPVGHIGDPDFVAEMVARLAGPDAGYVTGACWDFNGGLWMR
ncbi:SDR family NAD(P)-dependent oxidoreductase [Roseobacter sp. MH60115]|uniref:SDR family NAD(P)-dependent oxidoreductase n=1 Tax=Roseobacter sp. MH60115 TaxID=2785324 RepID=UPI002DD7B83C|nr:SDR family oxidoreductase [Roseobacter sp. MH60115]